MSALAGLLVVVAALAGFAAALALERVRRRRALQAGAHVRRIAFPFTGEGLSEPALAAALRLARAEQATLMPVYLALVPMRLAVEVPLREECDLALSLLEVIEQRAARARVPVDSRIERGRTVRHALRELLAHERFERMVVAAGTGRGDEGFAPEDVAWMLRRVGAELIVLRPARPAVPRATAASGDADAPTAYVTPTASVTPRASAATRASDEEPS